MIDSLPVRPTHHALRLLFWPQVLEGLAAGAQLGNQPLVIFDLGLVQPKVFDQLTEHGVGFITRLRKGARFRVEVRFQSGGPVRDSLITLGSAGAQCPTRYRVGHRLRLVEVLFEGQWYPYLTNVLDAQVLSGQDVAKLYRSRWRIEDAFRLVKRLLGLAYFYSGSYNAVALQVWMTWLLYSVVVDLSDEVAEALEQPLQRISLEMVFRGLYHFTQAYHRGEAEDPVLYLASAADLGIVKRKRRRRRSSGKTLTMMNSP